MMIGHLRSTYTAYLDPELRTHTFIDAGAVSVFPSVSVAALRRRTHGCDARATTALRLARREGYPTVPPPARDSQGGTAGGCVAPRETPPRRARARIPVIQMPLWRCRGGVIGTFTAALTGAPIAQGERSHAAITDSELGQATTTTAVD